MVALLEAFAPQEPAVEEKNRVGDFFLRAGDRAGILLPQVVDAPEENRLQLYDERRAASLAQKRQRRGNGKYPEYHYARNDENDQWLKNNGLYGRSDITLDQVKEAGEYGMKQASDAENVYHRNGEGNENNLKFTSRIATKENWWQRNVSNRYGRYELILRPNGDNTFTHVTESINMGTLNRGNNFVTHFVEDVLPYLQLGNTRE